MVDFSLVLRGCAGYKLKSDCPENFINAVRNLVPVRKLERTGEKEFSLCCFYPDAPLFERMAREMNVEILSKRYTGLIYTLYKYRKRTGLFLGMFVSLVFLFASQMFVWQIRVEGNEKVPAESIENTLREIGFCEGAYKKGVDIDSLVNNFLIKEKRISWIAVNFDGTVAHVEVKERKTMDKAVKKQNVNLVASHDGMILRVDALEGQTQVQKGDVATKGQMLVSAFVTGRNGEVTLRGAKGFVWANTQRKYLVKVPLLYYEKLPTGKLKKEFCIEILGIKIQLPSFSKQRFLMCEKTSEKHSAKLFNKLEFPSKIYTDTYSEYILCEKRRTEKQAAEYAEKISKEKLLKDSPKCNVASYSCRYEIADDVLVYTVNFECVENIAKELEFDLS